jgi:hypothetical protein
VLSELGYGEIAPNGYAAEEAKAWRSRDSIEHRRHLLEFGMVKGNSEPDQSVGDRKLFKHVDGDRSA